jgi:hypothetical protein
MGIVLIASLLFCAIPASAQPSQSAQQPGAGDAGQSSDQPPGAMPGMQMPGMSVPATDAPEPSLISMHPANFLQQIVRHATSGSSAEPNSTPVPMLMTSHGPWMLMFHANVFVLDEQQSSPRGADRFFSTNWLMGMAQRRAGRGVFTARAMFSLEPATIAGREYPLLFQQGETAYGHPIADGQHPHNFFMELAALYDLRLTRNALLSFYLAPVGDPALGPIAFPHRTSAAEDPLATLGHHQEDSTHIAADVATMGFAYRIARIEASGFHGREPGENRWQISQGAIDSWSTRLTLQPAQNWSGQYSYGRIHSPEALYPTENQERMTASILYNRPLRAGGHGLGEGNWASSIVWGRTRSLQDNAILNSYLLESTLRFRTRNHIWTRMENAGRSNELILGQNPLPPGFEEQPVGHVQAYTIGYNHDFDILPHLASALGAQVTVYGVPASLLPIYGAHPAGIVIFLRLRPFSGPAR